MLGALEDSGSANLEGSTGGRNDQGNVLVTVIENLGNAIMQEADANDALAGADILGGAGAALGVNFDVLIEVNQILDALIVAVHLDHGIEDQLGSTSGIVVGHPDETLVLFLEQIGPILGGFQTHAGQLIGIDHEAQDTLVDTIPVTISIAVHGLEQVFGVGGLIGFQQAILRHHVVGIGGAAESDISRGIAGFFLDLGLDLAGGQALMVYLDTKDLLEGIAGSGKILFLAAAVNGELTFGLSGSDEIFHTSKALRIGLGFLLTAVVLVAAADHQGEDHDDSKQHRQCFFHFCFSSIN